MIAELLYTYIAKKSRAGKHRFFPGKVFRFQVVKMFLRFFRV